MKRLYVTGAHGWQRMKAPGETALQCAERMAAPRRSNTLAVSVGWIWSFVTAYDLSALATCYAACNGRGRPRAVIGETMEWEPISEANLWSKIISAEGRMSPQILRLWEAIKVPPQKWAEQTYGTVGGGFWVVAIIGNKVIWFNDIEDGFNCSSGRNRKIS